MRRSHITFLIASVALAATTIGLTKTNLTSLQDWLHKDGGGRSVQDFINACPATSGCYIKLRPGTYIGAVTIDRPVVIEGSGFGTVIDSGVDNTPTITISGATVANSETALKNLRIVNRAIDGGADGRAITFSGPIPSVHLYLEDILFSGGRGGATSKPFAIDFSTAPNGEYLTMRRIVYNADSTAGGLFKGGNIELIVDELRVLGQAAGVPVFDFVSGLGSHSAFFTNIKIHVSTTTLARVPSGNIASTLLFSSIDSRSGNVRLLDLNGAYSGDVNFGTLGYGFYRAPTQELLLDKIVSSFTGTAAPDFTLPGGQHVFVSTADVLAQDAISPRGVTYKIPAPFLAGAARFVVTTAIEVTANSGVGPATVVLKLGGEPLHTITYASGTTGTTALQWEIKRISSSAQNSTLIVSGVGSVNSLYATSSLDGLAAQDIIIEASTGGITGKAMAIHGVTISIY